MPNAVHSAALTRARKVLLSPFYIARYLDASSPFVDTVRRRESILYFVMRYHMRNRSIRPMRFLNLGKKKDTK